MDTHMLITAPTIGRLLAVTRQRAHALAVAGTFGEPIIGASGWPHYALAAVERYAGVTFSTEQVIQACAPRSAPPLPLAAIRAQVERERDQDWFEFLREKKRTPPGLFIGHEPKRRYPD